MKKHTKIILLIFSLVFVLTACGDNTNDQEEATNPEAIYQQAENLIAECKYAEAAKKLDSIGSHKDATILSMYCKACDAAENGNYEIAITSLKALDSFKDSNMRALYYNARFWDESVMISYCTEDFYDVSARTAELERLEQAKAAYDSIPLFLDSAQRSAALDERIEIIKLAIQYGKGVAAGESGDYDAAFSIFQQLGDYQDAQQRIAYYEVRKADDELGDFTTDQALLAVADQYTAQGNYLDCKERATKLKNLAKWSRIYDSGLFYSFKFVNNISSVHYDFDQNKVYGLINTDGKLIMEPQNYSIYWSEDYDITNMGLVSLTNDDYKDGYADTTGKILLPPEYDYSYAASDEIVAVVKNEKLGFIDINCQFISEPQWDDLAGNSYPYRGYSFSEDLAAVRKNSYWGFIDTNGNIIIEPQWKNAENFSEGLAAVSNGKDYWYIDKTGNNVFNKTWDYCGTFSHGIAVVKIEDDQYCLINKNGEQISDIYKAIGNISEGYARVCKDDKWGYVDTTGTLISEPQWDKVPYSYSNEFCDFKNGFARVIKDGKYGLIDSTGHLVIAPEWDSVGGFYDGLSYVGKNGKYGFVNTSGDIVIEPIWDMAYSFINGYAEVQIDGKIKTTQEREEYRYAVITYGDKKCGIIDTNGNIVIEPEWDRIDIESDGYFIVTREDMKRGVLDQNGNTVIACDWDHLYYSGENLFTVAIDGQVGLINSDGEIIFGFGKIGR